MTNVANFYIRCNRASGNSSICSWNCDGRCFRISFCADLYDLIEGSKRFFGLLSGFLHGIAEVFRTVGYATDSTTGIPGAPEYCLCEILKRFRSFLQLCNQHVKGLNSGS